MTCSFLLYKRFRDKRLGNTTACSRLYPDNRKRRLDRSHEINEMMALDTTMDRFLLWIDSVGGYLVCLKNEVVIGQATSQANVDIPIVADIAREHLAIQRHQDHYVLKPFDKVRINGATIQDSHQLCSGDLIELGSVARLRFSRPHGMSATARLDFESRHRTEPFSDSVLLMAESCVMGPGISHHINCRNWKNDFVVYRRDEKLICRSMQQFQIDGTDCDGLGILKDNSRILGEDFSLSIEQI